MIKYILLLSLMLNSLFAWKMEADIITVKKTNNDTTTHINFRQTYDIAPVVFTMPSTKGGNPATVRVINVSTTGFDVYTIEPQKQDGKHQELKNIPYIAIEQGSHTLPDGSKIVADTISTKKYQAKGDSSSSWESITLSGFTANPTILTEIQTRNNERTDQQVPDSVSKPWLTVAVDDISTNGFKMALDRSETTDGTITENENIAYLAINSALTPGNHYFGDNKQNKIEYETILTDDKIKGYSDGAISVDFAKSYTNPVAVAKKSSRNEDDGGWFRRKNIEDDSISLVVDEDRAVDSERNHIEEKASILIFSEPFDVEFYPASNANMVINELLYRETKTGKNNDEFVELYVKDSGNLRGYAIGDQDCNYYIFKDDCQVNAGDYVILHTGTGTNSCRGSVKEFYQNRSQYFNNSKDDVLLVKPFLDVTTTTNTTSCGTSTFNGKPVDYIAYGSQDGAVDAIPTSLKGVTLDWDETYVDELDNSNKGVSISLTPNAKDSDKAGCWEFTASGNAADNGCSNYLATQDTNPNSSYKDSLGHSNNGMPNMNITKSSIVIDDPVNSTNNPKRIPGATLRYCFVLDNTGEGNADNVKVKDILSGDGKDNLLYKKSGSMIQNINTECNCQSAAMDESKGSKSGDDVTIDIGSVTGSPTPATSRGCAFIEVEVR